ncbi:ComEC/Rec2 family competence protein [Oribacterium sp. P6A1]|uniref:ComEC/Rec2 family competence protein n=1 Tax=Oribacterium sp. P6A1 TaxID=1410612 RepID=UPI000AAA1090|nr:ComEC/Rec2 family competence protein [Oribacterium sp. P6A1]
MNYKRPMLLIALVFVLGVCVTAVDAGVCFRTAAGVLFCGIIFHGCKSKRLSRGAGALLFVVLLLGVLRYGYEFYGMETHKSTIEEFGEQNVVLRGIVESFSVSDKNDRLVIRNGKLSNAYGRAETLATDAPEELKRRYDRDVGRVMVYLKRGGAETSLRPEGDSGGSGEAGPEGLFHSDEVPEGKGPYPGEAVEVYGKMIASEAPHNEGEFDFGLYYRSVGISGSMYGERLEVTGGEPEPFETGLQKIRMRVCGILDEITEEEDSGIYKALLAGEKSFMDKEIRELYQRNGIAHILAVSGLHLSIIGAGFHELLRKLGAGKKPAGVAASVLVISYGIFTGSSGSAMRAVIMLLMKFLGDAIGRSYDMLTALSLACLILVVEEPYIIFSSGFQLSFMAVLSLGIGLELPRPKNEVLNGIYMSLVLQICTLPPVLYHFFRFPAYGIFLNFIVLPFMGCVIYSGFLAVAVSVLSVTLSMAAIGSGHYILGFYTELCRKISEIPYASLLLGRPAEAGIILYYSVIFGTVMIVLFLKDMKKKDFLKGGWAKLYRYMPMISGIVILIAVYGLIPGSPGGLEITVLDVGQGDGSIIRCDGLVITVDGGSSSEKKLAENRLIPYLQSQAIDVIDAAFITHCDSDHYSGILDILEGENELCVKELFLPPSAVKDKRYDKIRAASAKKGTKVGYFGAGSVLETERLMISGLYPPDDEYISEANSHSIGMLLLYGDFNMLFTGDMDKECEFKMLEYMEQMNIKGETKKYGAYEDDGGVHGDDVFDIDVLKLGHHGSSTSTSFELLERMRPEYGIISYGRDNDYGHPHKETLEILKEFGTEPVETAKTGEIRIVSDGEGYEIYYPMRK